MFVGYCENSKSFGIYVPSQREIKLNRDVTYDEDASLKKSRDLPLPPSEKEYDDMDLLDAPYMPVPKKYVDDDTMESMDPSDPPPRDIPSRNRPL